MLKTTVGFVGIGNMGFRMATRLLAAKYKVIAYDINQNALKAIASNGATIKSSLLEIAKEAQTIITVLRNRDDIYQAYCGENGILSGLKAGSMVIDCSTIGPSVAKDIAAKVADKKSTFIDAPMSGGVAGAEAGTLTFMVGCDQAELAKFETLLKSMGSTIVHCGSAGFGQVAKLCNNMLMGVCTLGTCEALTLGKSLGLDPKILSKIINQSSGRNWTSEIYNPVPGVTNSPASRNYEPGFSTIMLEKDLRIAHNEASLIGVPVPMGSQAYFTYHSFAKIPEYRDKDFSSIYEFMNK